jgi:HAD superfamily hydrolase (TIGR01549 family)
MNFLFYLNPMVARGNPSFYWGAIEKKILPLSKILQSWGHEITFFCNEFDGERVQSLSPSAKVFAPTTATLVEHLGSANNIEIELYASEENEAKNRFENLLSTFPFGPIDCVFAWETPANVIRKFLPEAKVIHLMPGFLSRVPFPELFTVDFNGLFNESTLARYADEINLECPNAEGEDLVARIRAELLSFILQNNPFPKAVLDPTHRFSKLLLLPLQVTDQYAFVADSGYRSQFALLQDVLTQVPPDVGLVVTQYVNPTAQDLAITPENYPGLKERFPNLIYDESFNRIDNSSQYLLSVVDGVVTLSSSIGLQALLWKKPLITLGKTYLSSISTYSSVAAWYESDQRTEEILLTKTDAVLAWMLRHTQVLATKLHDEDFLSALLQYIEQGNPQYRLPDFYEMSDDYTGDFMARSKTDRASKLLKGKFNHRYNNQLDQRFKELLTRYDPALISFDIFDTLIDRKVEQPAHIFQLMEPSVLKITEGRLPNFKQIRSNAERKVRELAQELDGRDEITLYEIYDSIRNSYGLTEDQSRCICQLEVEEEFKSLGCRESGRRLYDLAVNSGARIILISDMYLPKDIIQKVLRNAGYPDIPLYLSSETGCRKHDGALFDVVTEAEGVGVNRWLHIGDNPHGDIAVPHKKGIKCFRTKSAFHLAADNEKYGKLIASTRRERTDAEAAIYGLAQKRFFDDPYRCYSKVSHFGGDPFVLGYIGMGPVFFGFLQWLMVDARKQGVEKVLFLSRDGKVLWMMAQILFPAAEGWPIVEYAYASRRSLRAATLFGRGDISHLVDSSISSATVAEFFYKKFGLTLTGNDDDLVKQFGFNSITSEVSASDREALRLLALELTDRILEQSSHAKKVMAEYYAELGVVTGGKVAICDIGYSGSLQASISRVTGVTDLHGYYYITFESANLWKHYTGPMSGYAGEFVKPMIHNDPICRNGFFYETLFCCSDPSFIGWGRSENGARRALFDYVENDSVRRQLVDKVHEGAVVLARELKRAFPSHIEHLSMSCTTASRIFNDFIRHPSGRDSEIFEGCLFDDGFAASKMRYIIPPREVLRKNPNTVKQAIWKEGAAVFARIPSVAEADKKKSRPTTKKREDLDFAASKNVSPEKRNQKKRGVQGRIIKFEAKLIQRFVNNHRKKNKYLRDREAYFRDSKSPLARFYLNVVTG